MPRTIPKGMPALTAQRGITFEEAEGVLMNFGHELRAKCSTLRIAIPAINAGEWNSHFRNNTAVSPVDTVGSGIFMLQPLCRR